MEGGVARAGLLDGFCCQGQGTLGPGQLAFNAVLESLHSTEKQGKGGEQAEGCAPDGRG
jgi:hypothetical protein